MKHVPRELLQEMFEAAIDAALPSRLLPSYIPAPPKGRTVVVGAGKASAAMAAALEKIWSRPLSGIVVTRDKHAVPCRRIEIVEASHPVPDYRGLDAARRILQSVGGLSEDDLVIALISGGGSALLALPAGDIGLEDKQAINSYFLRCGASIGEINCVRKHISQVKGGRLAAAAYPATMVTLLISDVPGDDPTVIASGPTLADRTTLQDARSVLTKYGITEPASIIAHLQSSDAETPKPGDPRLSRNSAHIIATPQKSLEAAAQVAHAAGIRTVILGDAIEADARELGRVMGGIAKQTARHGQPFPPPVILLSGGETSVNVRGNGKGGRNVEFLLSLAVELDGLDHVFALAGDTDGIDGSEEIAGAIITPDTILRARAAGLDPQARLADNDGHTFFQVLGDQIITGPTFTNVNDFRAVLITG